MAINYYANNTTAVADIGWWTYSGSSSYITDYDGYIKVDKGRPDKALFVIFYAIAKKDPMIFCKTKKELESELKKLMNREDVDATSIRVFALSGGIKKL